MGTSSKAVGQQDVYIQNERSFLGSRMRQIQVKWQGKKHKNKVVAPRGFEIMMPVALHSKSGYGVAEGPFLGGGKRAACTWSLLHTQSRG